MFTVKLYANGKQRILSCESVTSYAWDHGTAFQLTLHQRDAAQDAAYNVGDPAGCPQSCSGEIWWERAIIENATGKTTQIISHGYMGDLPPGSPGQRGTTGHGRVRPA